MAAIAGWVMVLVLLIGLYIVFDPLGSHSKVEPLHSNRHSVTGETLASDATDGVGKSIWESRCKLICCCARWDDQSTNAFSDVAVLFSDFFRVRYIFEFSDITVKLLQMDI